MAASTFSPARMDAMQTALDVMRGADSLIESKNQEAVRRLAAQMAKMPWSPASFISFHAFPLYFSNPLANELRIGAAPLATDDRFPKVVLKSGRKLGYTQHVFTTWARNHIPNDAGKLEVTAILPIDLALDFVGQDMSMNRGGVVCYEATTAPEETDPKIMAYVQGDRTGTTRGREMPLGEAFEYAHELQVKHYMDWHEKAEEAASGSELARKNVIHRSNVIKMARMLRAWGHLASDPVYMKVPNKAASEPIFCKSCGTESKPGAIKCTNGTCTYVFHPFKAFNNLVIDLQTPGAGLALRRLATAQVNQLIKWGRFTHEEALTAGHKFTKGKKGEEADAVDGNQPDVEDATGGE